MIRKNILENSNNSQIDLNVNVDVGSAATDPESVDQNIATSVVDLGFDATSADIDPLLNMSLDDINQAIMTWIQTDVASADEYIFLNLHSMSN